VSLLEGSSDGLRVITARWPTGYEPVGHLFVGQVNRATFIGSQNRSVASDPLSYIGAPRRLRPGAARYETSREVTI
jgi:hypothetical protein